MKFKPERSIFLTGEINNQTLPDTIAGISKLHSMDPKTIITLFIASAGGSVSDAFALYDFVMNVLKPNLQTVALGEVNSMAIMLLLMGDKRFIGKLTVMRFHRFSLTPNASINIRVASKIIEDLERSESHYINILMNRTGGKINKEKANALLDDNATITAKEAVKHGLAHRIL